MTASEDAKKSERRYGSARVAALAPEQVGGALDRLAEVQLAPVCGSASQLAYARWVRDPAYRAQVERSYVATVARRALEEKRASDDRLDAAAHRALDSVAPGYAR